MKSEGVNLLTGIVFSNVLGAVLRRMCWMPAGIYVSPNAGAVELRRQGLSPQLLGWSRGRTTRCMKAPASRPIVSA